MHVIKKCTASGGQEIALARKEGTVWQGFVLTGLSGEHAQRVNRSMSLSAAVALWNRVVPISERLSVHEVAATLKAEASIH